MSSCATPSLPQLQPLLHTGLSTSRNTAKVDSICVYTQTGVQSLISLTPYWHTGLVVSKRKYSKPFPHYKLVKFFSPDGYRSLNSTTSLRSADVEPAYARRMTHSSITCLLLKRTRLQEKTYLGASRIASLPTSTNTPPIRTLSLMTINKGLETYVVRQRRPSLTRTHETRLFYRFPRVCDVR